MSPTGKKRVGRVAAFSSNVYTIVLAFAFAIVLATTAFIAYKCYFQYDTFFKIP